MSDRAYAKIPAQQRTLSGLSPRSSLLQRTCACGQHTIAGGECSTCRNEQSTLHRSQRAFGPPSTPSPTQENITSLNSTFDRASRFGHDFSRIPVIQTKLQVNQLGDVYEREADQIAKQVMRMTDVESPVSDDEDEAKNSLMRKQSTELGANVATELPNAPPVVQDVLNSSGGQPLDTRTRAFMEPRFMHDFSQVRIHSDAHAAESARAVNALAYTVGQTVVFGGGQYAPESVMGRRLLAHELTHVIQQEHTVQPSHMLDQQGERNVHHCPTLALQRQVITTPDVPSTYTGKTDPNAIIPISDFINYVEVVEKAYPQDTPEDIVTRIRVHYYSGIKFEQLIPQAHTHDYVQTYSEVGAVAIPRILKESKIGTDAYKHLTAHADENPTHDKAGDNPSPYIQLANGERVDVGHLLLGLDALLHPTAGSPYTDYSIPSIDVASWVADLGIASVWMTQHEQNNKPPDDAPRKLSAPDLNAYYQMSAPTEDLLGDADTFGAHKQWTMTTGQKLSQVLRAYYLGTPGTTAGVKTRWQTFCARNSLSYTQSGSSITWSPTVKSSLISRINAFNDLYAAGTAGSLWGSITGPKKKSWPHTPQIIDMFLNWVKTHLEAELASKPQK